MNSHEYANKLKELAKGDIFKCSGCKGLVSEADASAADYIHDCGHPTLAVVLYNVSPDYFWSCEYPACACQCGHTLGKCEYCLVECEPLLSQQPVCSFGEAFRAPERAFQDEPMKIHLKTSDEPIPPGSDVTANCGTEIPKAVMRYWFDLEAEDSAFLNSLKTCRGCYATRARPGRYLSGIVSGQEAMTGVAGE